MRLPARVLRRHWREILLLALYILPFLALAALGSLWLWEKGYVWYFSAGSLALVACTVIIRSFWRLQPHGITLVTAMPGAAVAERRARNALEGILDGVSAADASSMAAAQNLAMRAVEAVAGAYHPGDAVAWLNVTVPELLLMTEDMSRRVREALGRDLPILRYLDISLAVKGQALAGHATGLWNIARVLRFMNPSNALLQEAKSVIVNKALGSVTGATKARMAAIIVREVGEVAVKLYSGGYRRTEAELLATEPMAVPPPPVHPLVVLIAGQGNTGKSSLLNALAGNIRVPAGHTLPTDQFFTVELEYAEVGRLVLVDSPGVGAEPSAAWLVKAREADLIVWVVAANRADRAADQKALGILRRMTQDDIQLRETLILLAATHADRVNPPMEWLPPYDPNVGESAKERSMREALAAASASLTVPPNRCAIVSVESPGLGSWNVEALWARIHTTLPEAKQKQLERSLHREGWMRAAIDAAKSIQGAVGRAYEFIGK